MVSFKNGILNIKIGKPNLDTAVDISFFMLMCSLYANRTRVEGENYFYYASFFLFLGTTVIKLFARMKSKESVIIPSFTLWYGGFLLLSVASMLWAPYPENSMLVFSRMVQSTVITFCMAQNYATRASLMRCVKLYAWSGAYAALYLLIKTPTSEWFSGGFGASIVYLNSNAVGMIFTLCLLVSFFLAIYCKEKIFFVFSILQLFIVVLTSSRKSLLTSVLGIVVFLLMRSNKRTVIWRVLAAMGIVVAVYFIIMSVPEFYSAIGVRFESMFNHLNDTGGDYSISLRQIFIGHARDMFFEKPLLGYGINNFIVQIGFRTGVATYAHNNYYEILADLGVVGFTVFYGFYFYILISLVKIWRNGNSSLVKLMIVWVSVIMICEYGIVSYYTVYIQMTLCMAYLFLCAHVNTDNYSSGVPSYLKYGNVYD